MGLLPLRSLSSAFLFLLFAASGIQESGPAAIFWTAPAILASALMIAWAAESAQFFIAQGFALAILAWMQTLPEFAVEAVIAWHRETHLLLASLTGALRLLTGLGWPVIYFTAAIVHRRRTGTPLRNIRLNEHHAVEVVGLAVPLLYFGFIIWKGTLALIDSAVLIGVYGAYLLVLSKMPAEDSETIDQLEAIPRKIVTSPRPSRIVLITALFLGGGLLIYYSAEPFLASLLALSTVVGMPAFVFLQWITPIASEFPEMASTFYWARTVERAPLALMNMVSSNINQWSLLPALLPVLLSMSSGTIARIVFDETQSRELVMTLAQALVGLMFLVNMELAFWEATLLCALFLIPFTYAPLASFITAAYFIWAGVELVRILLGKRQPRVLAGFAEVWKTVRKPG
jgi:cation:H+ antiporter